MGSDGPTVTGLRPTVNIVGFVVIYRELWAREGKENIRERFGIELGLSKAK